MTIPQRLHNHHYASWSEEEAQVLRYEVTLPGDTATSARARIQTQGLAPKSSTLATAQALREHVSLTAPDFSRIHSLLSGEVFSSVIAHAPSPLVPASKAPALEEAP